MSDLIDAIRLNDVARARKIIALGVDLNERDAFGYSALHTASAIGAVPLALELIAAGIDVNAQDGNGLTILHYCAIYDQVKLAQACLNTGANICLTDRYGNQPLWTAVFHDKGRNDRLSIVKLYIRYGADPGHRNFSGKSPRDFARAGRYLALEKLLLD